ncbi:MAG: hypothetical protein AAFO67_07140, partial [Planctomycetota bacterium]
WSTNQSVDGPVVVAGGKSVNPVVGIDPRPLGLGINQATNAPPSDGFYSPVSYRGGFSQTENWCLGWTAADEFGFFLGGACSGDVNGDGEVGFSDLTSVLADWGCTGN